MSRPLFVVFVIALAVFAYWAWQNRPVPPNTLVLREDGWHPAELTVEAGTAVTFVNETKNAFWPASNSHPQHDQYPEFDSGHPIMPGESWAFTFDKKGKWAFHDHLRSFYTGYINVGAEYAEYDCLQHLENADVGAKRTCWSEKLLDDLQKNGAASAFRLFAKFYESDSDFSVIGCHIMAHQLGDDAYGEYLRYGKNLSKLEFPPESIYCGYGYYHGILEHMIRDNPDFEKADAFCKQLIRAHESEIPRIRLNCYHAIGHGFVPEPTEVEEWGNPHELPQPAITACKRMQKDDERTECLQGAFNVIGDWMWNNQFGLRYPKDDPLSVCRSFDDAEVSKACYYEISMRLLPAAGGDLKAVYVMFAETVPDDIAGLIMNSAAASIAGENITGNDFLPFLYACRALPERVHEDCLKGITGAFVAHGDPEHEYVKALAFCGDEELTDDEKDTCYWNVIRTFKAAYSREKVASICTEISEPYRQYCAYQ